MRRIPVALAWAVLLIASAGRAHAQCAGSPPVRLRVFTLPDGPRMAVWSPDLPESCERSPLILFSHGFNGCGTQVVFLTTALARAGYIVGAPDHRDAACSVDGPRLPHLHFPKLPFSSPGHWNDTTYRDRRDDLEHALDGLLASPEFRGRIDPARIGALGHSLGGYSVLGLAGGWESWRDPRIQAVVALAPYLRPFLVQHRLASVHVPVMYQAAQFDPGVTPTLRGASGAFLQSPGPAYYLELARASHFEWTNGSCWGQRDPAACVAGKTNPKLIADYTVAFFDAYLKQRPEALRQLNGKGLRAFLQKPGL